MRSDLQTFRLVMVSAQKLFLISILQDPRDGTSRGIPAADAKSDN